MVTVISKDEPVASALGGGFITAGGEVIRASLPEAGFQTAPRIVRGGTTVTPTPTVTPTLAEEELQQSLPADIRDLPVEEVLAQQTFIGGQTRQPFFQQEIVETFEPRPGVQVPITGIFFVDPRIGLKRRATEEEQRFFREQPGELQALTIEQQPTLFGGFLQATQQLEFGELFQVIGRERREISQRRPEQQIVGFGLGLAVSGLTTAQLAKQIITEPIQTIKAIPSGVALGAAFVSSGALVGLIETEPGFVTGFAVGEIGQAKALGRIVPRRKRIPKRERLEVQFIEPQPIRKTPLSRTFPLELDLRGIDFKTPVRQKQQLRKFKAEFKPEPIKIDLDPTFIKEFEFARDIQRARFKSGADIIVIDKKGVIKIVEPIPRFKRKKGIFFDLTPEFKRRVKFEAQQPLRFDIPKQPKAKKLKSLERKGIFVDFTPEFLRRVKFEAQQPLRFDIPKDPKARKLKSLERKGIFFDLTPEFKRRVKFEAQQPLRFDLVAPKGTRQILVKPKLKKPIQKTFLDIQPTKLTGLQELTLRRLRPVRPKPIVKQKQIQIIKTKDISPKISGEKPALRLIGIPRMVGGEGLTKQQLRLETQREVQLFQAQQRIQKQQTNILGQGQIQAIKVRQPEFLRTITEQRFRQPERQRFLPLLKTRQREVQLLEQPQLQIQKTRQRIGTLQTQLGMLGTQRLLQAERVVEIPRLRQAFKFPLPPPKRPLLFKLPEFELGTGGVDLFAKRKFIVNPSLADVLRFELGFKVPKQPKELVRTGFVGAGIGTGLPRITLGSLIGEVTKKKRRKNKK